MIKNYVILSKRGFDRNDMRVLVVEDEILLGEGICAGLKQSGYTVDWAQDGISAESAILLENFDAVVLDIGLPGKDGISVLSAIRKKGCSVPVLILTARDAVDDLSLIHI